MRGRASAADAELDHGVIARAARWHGAQCNRQATGENGRAVDLAANGGTMVAVRIPLERGAWLDHDPDWLSEDDADAALAALRGELEWEQREIVLFGRRILQPRLIAWAGEVGYRYSGQTLEPRAFTPAARRLLERVRAEAGAPFNHVLVNRYRSGEDSMGLHADDEPELGRDPRVATVSLGASRRFIVKPRRKGDGPRQDLDARPRGAPRDGGHLSAPLRPRCPAPGEHHGRADQPDLSAAAPRPGCRFRSEGA